MTLQDVLRDPERISTLCWLYLPKTQKWTLSSEALVLEDDEVTEDEEDDPEAGVPKEVRDKKMMRALEIGAVQQIVANARAQKANVSDDELLKAFLFYYDNDAFASL